MVHQSLSTGVYGMPKVSKKLLLCTARGFCINDTSVALAHWVILLWRLICQA